MDSKDGLDSKFQMFYYLSIDRIESGISGFALMSPPPSYDFSSAKPPSLIEFQP